MAALSVDAPEQSRALGRDLSWPGPLLCDPSRRAVTEWGLLNSSERGGIARPAVYILEPDLRVRWESVDAIASRVDPRQVLKVLDSDGSLHAGRNWVLPGLSHWLTAARRLFRQTPAGSERGNGGSEGAEPPTH